MQDQSKPSLWKQIYGVFSHGGNLITWGQVAAAGLLMWRSGRWPMMPAINQPLEYLGAKLAVFCGAFFVAGGVVQITRLSIPKVKRWRNPPMLSIIAHNGDRLILTLTHSGDRTVWQARRRITKMLYSGPNPSPEPQLCTLRKDGKGATELPMEDGETASIILVYPYASEWHSRPWILELGYAHSSGHGDQFSGEKGVIVEVEIKAIPPLKDGPTRLCYKVTRRNTNDVILAEDVPCEKFQVL